MAELPKKENKKDKKKFQGQKQKHTREQKKQIWLPISIPLMLQKKKA